jgi:putative membrane protein
MWILLLIVIGAGIYFIYRSQAKQAGLTGRSREPESALDIARSRYARGEISREQFEEIRRDLEQ